MSAIYCLPDLCPLCGDPLSAYDEKVYLDEDSDDQAHARCRQAAISERLDRDPEAAYMDRLLHETFGETAT